jgi:hypothetical protein
MSNNNSNANSSSRFSGNGRSDNAGLATADLYDDFSTQARSRGSSGRPNCGGDQEIRWLRFCNMIIHASRKWQAPKRLLASNDTNKNGGNHSYNHSYYILVVDGGGPSARCAVMGDLGARARPNRMVGAAL